MIDWEVKTQNSCWKGCFQSPRNNSFGKKSGIVIDIYLQKSCFIITSFVTQSNPDVVIVTSLQGQKDFVHQMQKDPCQKNACEIQSCLQGR